MTVSNNNNIKVKSALLRRDIQVICKRLDVISEDIKKIEGRLENVEQYGPVVKIVVFIGGALGVTLIAFIWSLLTSQIQIVIP